MSNRLTAVIALFLLISGTYAQSERSPEGIIRCHTMEVDEWRRADDPSLGTLQDFERWLAPRVQEYEANASEQRAVITIPVVFHVVHDDGADNLSATYINAQIDQLNQDFGRYGAGSNTDPDGADTDIQFCAATINPSGGNLAEPGINRVDRSTVGFTSPPYSSSYIDNTIKPTTIWDPTEYCNIWVMDLGGGLLGYAQFPEAPGLPGVGTGNGGASTDGVVVLYSSVGSVATPHPQGGNYARGRTLTHEIGHWLGLRHIWGDGGCSVDDYCDDTPTSDAANYGCPTNHVSCSTVDQVENYMDYTDDIYMNIFTQDQKARMQAVLASSVRRASLASSPACGGGGSPDTDAPTTPTNLTASNITTTTVDLSWNASSDNVGVTAYNVLIDGTVLGSVAGTTATVTGLSPSTTYTAGVQARDAAGNVSGTATVNFTTLAITCVDGELTLTITLDNYPQETSWEITSGGSTVASGGTYESQPDGSTVIEDISLTEGDYSFTIFDSYGDGICCDYGTGSYSLTSGATTIINGGSFGASESVDFCVEGGAAPDTEAPTVPGNVNTVNITKTTATVIWSASSDNIGVTGYNVYVDGVLYSTVTDLFENLTDLDPGTDYTVCVTAVDAAGNESGAACDNFTTLEAPDDQPPTTPGNVTAYNVTETTADVSWNASSDNEGVVSYNIYLNGQLIDNTISTSTSLSGLTSNTTYTVGVTALDQAGNESAEGTDVFTTPGGGPSTEVLFGHYFETGYDGWVDGGTDCQRYRGNRSWEGLFSIRLRDNSGVSSSMTLYNVDVTGFDQLEFQFYFYPQSMENGEDFGLLVHDGTGWQVAAVYTSGSDFSNNSFYVATVTLSASDYNFNSGFDFRLLCDASANSDRIYIDQVTLTGINNGRDMGTTATIEALGSLNAEGVEAEHGAAAIDLFDGDLKVYPNPARDALHFITNTDAEIVRIFSVTGMLVAEQRIADEGLNTIDISRLQAGSYILHIQSEGEVFNEQFIKIE